MITMKKFQSCIFITISHWLFVLLLAGILLPSGCKKSGDGDEQDAGGTSTMTTATAKQVTAGAYHTCVLTTTGGVKCWGNNTYGQLGSGTNSGPQSCSGTGLGDNPCSMTPVDVIGIGSSVTTIAAGTAHTCALTGTGTLKCWGANGFGELGDGTATNSSTPVNVSGLGSPVKVFATGNFHTCALTSAGTVKCWGDNIFGQLGNGSNTGPQSCGNDPCSTSPVDVSGLGSKVTGIAAGWGHSCVLLSTGGVKCWGDNSGGQLGIGTTSGPETCASWSCSTQPVDVPDLKSGVSAIAAGGFYTCAVTSSGSLKCWGANNDGQLGNGNKVNSATPVDVAGLGSGVMAVDAGDYHTCAVTTTGALKCWGQNYYGELGNGTITDSSTSVDVTGLASGIAAVATGQLHTCALTSAGAVKCWGYSAFGQLGIGTNTGPQECSAVDPCSPTPVDVIGF